MGYTWIYQVLFWAVPISLFVFLGISIFRYVHAKVINGKYPGTYSASDINKRMTMMIIFSIITGLFQVVVGAFIAFIYMAVAYM